VLAPFVDYSYSFNYASAEEENYLRFLSYFYNWYSASYGSAVAERWKGRALFSSGVFPMTARCPLWEAWAAELEKSICPGLLKRCGGLPLGRANGPEPLDLLHRGLCSIGGDLRLHCHVGAAERDPGSGQVVIQYPPRRAVGTVHLSYSSKMMQSYLERGAAVGAGSLFVGKGDQRAVADRSLLTTLDKSERRPGSQSSSEGIGSPTML